MWPLTDYDASKVLAAFTVFAVPYTTNLIWARYPARPTTDLIIITGEDGPLVPAHGYVIADGKIIVGDTYDESSFVGRKTVIAAATVANNDLSICAHLTSIDFEERTYMAILKAAADNVAMYRILKTESKIFTKRVKRLPHPLTLLSICAGKEIDGTVESDGTIAIDICDAMLFWPRHVGRREIHFTNGVAKIDIPFLITGLENVIMKYLTRLATSDSLQTWIASDEDSMEHRLLDEMMTRTAERKRRMSDSVVSDGAPPPCIVALCEKGKREPWKNDERYQLGYVISSLAAKRGVDGKTIAEPFVNFMRDTGMGEGRIKEFLGQIRPQYTDKRTCRSRARLASGIVCPVGSVKKCLSMRKGAIFIDPETTTIANVWAYSDK